MAFKHSLAGSSTSSSATPISLSTTQGMSARKPVIMEVNLISAQQLPRGSKLSSSTMETYAVVYLNPDQKLHSRIDKIGDVNPTWNDKFIFVLDEDLQARPGSCLVFEIYSRRRFQKDKLIGVVRVLLENLISNDLPCRHDDVPRKFAGFHVRDPHGEPHGVLNIGTAILNGMFHDRIPKFLSSNCAADHRMLMVNPSSLPVC